MLTIWDNATHIGHKTLGWRRRRCHTNFRSSQDFTSLGNLKLKQQAKLSGELLWILHVPDKLQLRSFPVSRDWPGFEVNIKASWGQRNPKVFYLPPFFLYSCPRQCSLIVSRTPESSIHRQCIQVCAVERWAHKQDKSVENVTHFTWQSLLQAQESPDPHLLLSLPPTPILMLGMPFFGGALKTVPGECMTLTAQSGM